MTKIDVKHIVEMVMLSLNMKIVMMATSYLMMVVMNAIINVYNFVQTVKKAFVLNVMFLDGRFQNFNVFQFVEMEKSMEMNNVMMVI